MLLSEEFKYRLINMCRIMPGKEKTVRKGKKIMQNNQITYEFASKIAYDVINKSTFDGIGEAYDMGIVICLLLMILILYAIRVGHCLLINIQVM